MSSSLPCPRFAFAMAACIAAACSSVPQRGSPARDAVESEGPDAGDASSPPFDANGSAADARDAEPPPAGLAFESGFIDVPAQTSGAKVGARMFYAFQPADEHPEAKPLFVLFNGGPGYPTSAGLVAFGTGAMTLDEALDGPPRTNAARWTRFANLLFVDERDTGFSYGLGPVDARCSFHFEDDASDFVRVVLRFLAAHPAIRKNPVVLTGESYGGMRAMMMLAQLLRYSTDGALDPKLVEEIQAHYDATLGAAGAAIDPAQAARQFGRAVLIEPLLVGDLQYDQQAKLIAADPILRAFDRSKNDSDHVLKPAGWSMSLTRRVLNALADTDQSRALLGTDLGAVNALLPANRTGAARPEGFVDPAMTALNDALTRRFGALARGDRYYALMAPACGYSGFGRAGSGNQFLANLHDVRMLLTNARYDYTIVSAAIPAVLATVPALTVAIDTAPRDGVARPGWIRIDLPATPSATPPRPAKSVTMRYPSYEKSGHMVAVTEPQELADDVAAWLVEP